MKAKYFKLPNTQKRNGILCPRCGIRFEPNYIEKQVWNYYLPLPSICESCWMVLTKEEQIKLLKAPQ